MRRLSRALCSLLALIGVVRASDLPTLKPTPLPDVSVPQTAPIAPIDLRNYFEISSVQGQVVQFQTSVGTVNMEMLATAAPNSVTNFVNYVTSGRYANTFVHRSDKGLGIIQAGGYSWPSATHVTTDAPIALEYNLPNTRGTVAMARTSDLNSATSEWFINTDDNTTDLGPGNGGGYAVFARIIGTGMTVVDAVASWPVYNANPSTNPYGPFGQLPLTGNPTTSIAAENLAMIYSAATVPLFPTQAAQAAVASFSVVNSNPNLLTVSVQGSTLTFAPVAGKAGMAAITVKATDSNGNSVQETFRVTIGLPEIALADGDGNDLADGSTVALGSVAPGAPMDLTFTIRNDGTGNLNLSGSPRVKIDGADASEFSVPAQPATPIAVGDASTFTVRFNPLKPGPKTATLHIANNDSDESSFDLNLTADVPTITAAAVSKGVPVPDAGVDQRIPADATWGTFGIPSATMNSALEVGWAGTVLVPKATGFTGIFSGPLGAPRLRLRTGETANGSDGQPMTGVTFKAFRTPVFAGADFAFGATIVGKGVVPLVNDGGVWVNSSGTLRAIARTGTVAPGAGSAKFLAISSVAMPAPSTVFFVGKLAAPVGKDLGLWSWTSSGGATLIARTGSLVDLGAGPVTLKSFTALSSVAGSTGQGRYDSSAPSIDLLLTTTTGVTAIGSASVDGTLHLTQRSGVTDTAGRFVKSVGIPSSAQNQLASAIATFLPNPALGLSTANSRAIFDFQSNAILAQTGVAAPDAGTAKFLSFQNPVAGLGSGGQRITAFGATLTGTTTDRDTGIWAHSAAGGLALVAREGFEPPGAPRTKWAGFSSLSVMEGRGPIFTARLLRVAPTVTAANDRGLWATDSSGVLRLLVRTGDTIDGHKLSSFTLLGAVAGSPGQRRAWTSGDDAAHIVYQAAFTDGSSAIVNTLVP